MKATTVMIHFALAPAEGCSRCGMEVPRWLEVCPCEEQDRAALHNHWSRSLAHAEQIKRFEAQDADEAGNLADEALAVGAGI